MITTEKLQVKHGDQSEMTEGVAKLSECLRKVSKLASRAPLSEAELRLGYWGKEPYLLRPRIVIYSVAPDLPLTLSLGTRVQG